MTLIYFVRHGQSMGNLDGEFHGHYDSSLSELGHRQAERAAEFLKDKKIEKVYASDLNRAFSTAKHIADKYGIKVIQNKGLREINGGKWEKMKFVDIEKNYAEDYAVWRNNLCESRCPGGESIAELYGRINGEVEKLAAENNGKIICIATHATPLRALKCKWLNKPLSDIQSVSFVPNASVSAAEYYSDGTIKLILDAECAFMGDEITALPKII